MCMVMTRSGAEFWSQTIHGKPCNWPREWAKLVNGKPVTWKQINAGKTERQNRRLQWKRERGPFRCAAYLWTFYQPGLFGFAYAGWWAYLWTVKEWWKLSFDEGSYRFKGVDAMRLLPLGFLPIKQNFEPWMEEFARVYNRPGRFEKQGLLIGWAEAENHWSHPHSFLPINAKA